MEFLSSLLIPFVIGLLVGLVAKHLMKMAAALIALMAVLMAVGYVSPPSLASVLATFEAAGPQLLAKAERLASFIPYSSVTFFLGLALGFFKG